MHKTLFLIDAHAYIYQLYYAISRLTSPKGDPVQAVFGFARMIRRIQDEYHPDYLAVADDLPGKTFRHEFYEDYKANRKPPPDDLIQQLPLINKLLDLMKVPVITVEGFEADDVMATLATKAAAQGVRVVLVTPDKDIQQVLDDQIEQIHFKKNEVVRWTADSLPEEKGITPGQVIDFQALMGDSTDNVPGVTGVGPKTALELIQKWRSIDNLYDHIDDVKETYRKKLVRDRDMVKLSKRLVTLKTDVPVELDLDACRVDATPSAELIEFFKEMDFRTLLPEDDRSDVQKVRFRTQHQQKMFGDDEGAQAPQTFRNIRTETLDYRAIDTEQEFLSLLEELQKQQSFAFDLETTSESPRAARIVGLSFSWEPRMARYVAVSAPKDGPHCDVEAVMAHLKPLLESEDTHLIGQNLKYDSVVCRNYGVEPRGVACDTMVASYLLDPSQHRHNIDDIAMRLLGYEKVKTTDVIGKGKAQKNMRDIPVNDVAPYACEDADIALQISRMLMPKLEENDLLQLFTDIEMKLLPVLADMEWTGIKVDMEHLKTLSKQFDTEIKRLEEQIYEKAGKEFNIRSTQQLAAILFDDLGLPKPRGRRTKSGISTDSSVLGDLSTEHPIAGLVLGFRQLEKLKSTYSDALVRMINPETGRIHTSFNQTVTATGRLSSSDPNLQNIPIRTAIGQEIRACFIPSAPDRVLISADYSQVELRVMAHCSGDENLINAFQEGRDIHAFVAARINDVPIEEVTSEMRQRAKAVNFGIIYGQGANGLARNLQIPVIEAKRFIDAYFDRYPKVKDFIGRTIHRARNEGSVTTLSGRRRLLPELSSHRGVERSAGERIAVNTVIQGTAADLIKIAMIRVRDNLRRDWPEAALLLQIHDELLLEAPEADARGVADMVADTMSSAMELRVPLKVDVGIGQNWRDVK